MNRPSRTYEQTPIGPCASHAGTASVDALEAGELAGAGLDVLEQEPPAAGSRLLARRDVILAPPTGCSSEESLVDLQTKSAQDVLRVLWGRGLAIQSILRSWESSLNRMSGEEPLQ